MRTLHVGLRVSDRERSLAFYTALGYDVLGEVPGTEHGDLVMLKLPGDEFVSLELVHDPARGDVEPGGLNHLVVQVGSLGDFVADLATRGVETEAPGSPDGSEDFRTGTGSSWSSGPPATPRA
jgi:lactoylglutathione lyase